MATRKRVPGVKSTSGTTGGAKSRPSAKRAAKGKATKKAAARRGKPVVEYFEGPATAGGSSLAIVFALAGDSTIQSEQPPAVAGASKYSTTGFPGRAAAFFVALPLAARFAEGRLFAPPVVPDVD